MACYSPLHGWRSNSGDRTIVFNRNRAFIDLPVTVPCGQCIGCRLERSRQWAVRCVHEASLHDQNCFITLTYDNDHLPSDGSLQLEHFQLFMKRLRKAVGQVRFFHCGEYGTNLGRPHYHAIIFGYDFADKVLWRDDGPAPLYRSALLERLWKYGYSTVGTATFESAAYVARYITKKITGPMADDHYAGRKPEYTTMSRRPGIGAGWFDKFSSDVFPSDEVILRGKAFKPPRFYDGLYEVLNPDGMKDIKARRQIAASKHSDNNTPERLAVRREVKLAQIQSLKRPLQ